MAQKITSLSYLALSLLLSINSLSAAQEPARFNTEKELIAAMTPSADELPDLTILAHDILQLLEEQFQVDQPDTKCQELEKNFSDLYQTIAIQACTHLAKTNELWSMGTYGQLSNYQAIPNIELFKYSILHQASYHFALQRLLAAHEKVVLKLYSQSCSCDIDKSFKNIIKRSPSSNIYFVQVDHLKFHIPGLQLKTLPTLVYFKNGQAIGVSDYQNEEQLQEYIKAAFTE